MQARGGDIFIVQRIIFAIESEEMDDLVTMDEAAKRLGVSEAAVARRLLTAAGLTSRIGKRVLVVRREDLEKYAQERGDNPGPGRPSKKSTEPEASLQTA